MCSASSSMHTWRCERSVGTSLCAPLEESAGPLFPSSWTSTIGMEGSVAAKLVPRADLKAEEGMLQDILATATPSFERSTEDGTAFLIFKLGSLEAPRCPRRQTLRLVTADPCPLALAAFSRSPQRTSTGGRVATPGADLREHRCQKMGSRLLSRAQVHSSCAHVAAPGAGLATEAVAARSRPFAAPGGP